MIAKEELADGVEVAVTVRVRRERKVSDETAIARRALGRVDDEVQRHLLGGTRRDPRRVDLASLEAKR